MPRFTRWSGTQDPFGPDLRPHEVLDAIGDSLLDGEDPARALADLYRRGVDGRVAGLDELRRRLAEARQAELDRMGLAGPLDRLADAVDEIVELERTALQFADDTELAARKNAELDRLPDDPAGRLGGLQHYDFHDQGAREAFERLLDELRADVAHATFGQLVEGLEALDDAAVARLRDFLAEVNDLAARQDAGEEVSEAFEDLRRRYPDLIPGDPETLDDLLEDLARRAAAMSRLLAGLDPSQRAQLSQMAAQVLDDPGLALQVQALTEELRRRFPDAGWDDAIGDAPQRGAESGGFGQTVDWIERLGELDRLDEALGQAYPGARLEDVDEEALRSAVGEEAVRDVRQLKAIERLLEETGAVRRRDGQLELTPRGVRRLGERSLARIFERAYASPLGEHLAVETGGDAEPTGSTRVLRFGDPFRIDVSRSLFNAVQRGGDADGGLRLRPDDFELAEASKRVRVVTVLLLDMSFSMPLRGNWDHAKRLALALQSLVAAKFPLDTFHIVGFSDYARRLGPSDLLVSGWERVYGTNMQHAFLIARRLLSASPGTERNVIMVTDGEPTAHLDADGFAHFNWPPLRHTLTTTMAEAVRLSRTGCALNVFLLDHDPGAAAFIEQMVRRVGGRIFYPSPRDLGDVVVRDFLRRRRA